MVMFIMVRKNSIRLFKMTLKVTLRLKDKQFGNTYDVYDTKTGKTFTIDEYPKNQRRRGDAKYIVQEKGAFALSGTGWITTRTLREAKERIKKVV